LATGGPHPKYTGNRRYDKRRVNDRGKVDQKHPVGEGLQDRSGGLQRQARLAGATRPGERNQVNPRSRDVCGQFRKLGFSADQRVRLGRQIRGTALKAPEGREPVWEVRANHLPDLLRLLQVTQLVATELA
jgi:hypothetical protein